MRNIYYDPKSPSSFSGSDKLHKIAKKHNISLKDTQQWLKLQKTHNLYVQPRNKFRRTHVIVDGFNEMWDVDLADMSALSKYNNGITFLLLTIDIFSRQALALPVKNKRGFTIADNLKTMFTKNKPLTLRSDAGTEFRNKHVQELLKELEIKQIIMYSDTKANYIERFILTLKRRLYKYMRFNKTFKYVDVLQDIITSYNNTFHSSLNCSPISVNKANENLVRLDQHLIKFTKYKPLKLKGYKYELGDSVRISHARKAFDKSYFQRWTQEIFNVSKRYKRSGISVYDLVDWNGEDISGSFYTEQLQKANPKVDTVYEIEKILKRRTLNKQKQLYIKWDGWSSKFNSWIPATNLEEYTKKK